MSKIFLASPHLLGREREYLKDAINSNWIAPLGPYVSMSERIVEDITGSPCAALSTGTAALHLAMIEAGVKQGDIVFCTDMTFSATVNPAIYQGAKPVFIDSDDESYNMSPEALEKAIRIYGKPKLVILAHIYGTPADWKVFEICRIHGIPIVEDASETLGAKVNGRYAGTIGTFGVYSFNGNKIVTGSTGGMVVCHDEQSKKHIINLATQAKVGDTSAYWHKEVGYNYRMSNITAAILCAQIETLDQRIALKKHIYDGYAKRLNGFCGCKMLQVPADRTSNYWLSVLITEDVTGRTVERIVATLGEHDIQSRRVWTPLHWQPIYSGTPFIKNGASAVSEDFFQRAICLPSDTHMTDEDIERVSLIVQDVLSSRVRGGRENV